MAYLVGGKVAREKKKKKERDAKEQKAKLSLRELYLEIIQKCCTTWLFMFQE